MPWAALKVKKIRPVMTIDSTVNFAGLLFAPSLFCLPFWKKKPNGFYAIGDYLKYFLMLSIIHGYIKRRKKITANTLKKRKKKKA